MRIRGIAHMADFDTTARHFSERDLDRRGIEARKLVLDREQGFEHLLRQEFLGAAPGFFDRQHIASNARGSGRVPKHSDQVTGRRRMRLTLLYGREERVAASITPCAPRIAGEFRRALTLNRRNRRETGDVCRMILTQEYRYEDQDRCCRRAYSRFCPPCRRPNRR